MTKRKSKNLPKNEVLLVDVASYLIYFLSEPVWNIFLHKSLESLQIFKKIFCHNIMKGIIQQARSLQDIYKVPILVLNCLFFITSNDIMD